MLEEVIAKDEANARNGPGLGKVRRQHGGEPFDTHRPFVIGFTFSVVF